MKKIMFLGRGNIGERCLEILLRGAGKTYDLAAICSNPSTHVWWKSNAIFREAQKRGIPFVSNETRNENLIRALIESESVDILISIQHIWILSSDILRAVDYQALNLHNAKLPDYKGYCTINHALVNGDRTYTSTVHRMIEEVDRGALAFEETVPIADDDTAISLYKKSCIAAIAAFERLVACLVENREIPSENIQGRGHFYTKNDLAEIREIKNPRDADEMDRKARGLFFPPFEPAFYRLGGKKVYVLPESYSTHIDAATLLRPFEGENENPATFVISPDTRR